MLLILMLIFQTRLTKRNMFECTDGKDPSKMTKKEYLLQFSKGICSPVIIAPSLFDTKMIFEILNCVKFQQNYSDIFSVCGFTDCKKNPNEFWKKVPDSEYDLWIPYFSTTMSILSPFPKPGMCFARLVAKEINFNEPVKNSIITNDAYRIRIMGNTPKTKGTGECGVKVVSDLSPYPIQFKITKVFGPLFTRMKKMGYVSGLTFQALPYDWAKSYRNNEFNQRFPSNLRRLNRLTNKKVVILGLSLGTLNIYYQLTKMSIDEKDRLIKNWVSLGLPTFGVSEGQSDILSGTDYLVFLKGLFGLKADASIIFTNNQQSVYEMLAFDYHDTFKGQRWFKAFNDRIAYEKGEVDFQNSGFAFLPKKDEICSPAQFEFAPQCFLGISNSQDTPVADVLGDIFYVNQTRELLKTWNSTEHVLSFYDHIRYKPVEKLPNPGVALVAFVLRSQKTVSYLKFKEDVRVAIKRRRYPKYDKVFVDGDGTVNVNSLMGGLLKWAFEFDDKKVQGAKPVKIIDFCSVYKVRDNPYDFKNETDELHITKNEFIGSNCECLLEKDPSKCNHAKMISDKFAVDFMINTFLANENGYSDEFNNYINGLSDTYLIDVSDKCVQLEEDNELIQARLF